MKRSCGILLSVSSLPSPYGIGSLGKAAYNFVDFLAEAGQAWWQMLPVGPTSHGDSPYQSFSTYAGNPYFVDLDMLVEDGLLTKEEIDAMDWGSNSEYVDYEKIYNSRFIILKKALDRGWERDRIKVKNFELDNAWLPDYALYMALKRHFGMKAWTEWDEDIRLRQGDSVERYRKELDDDVRLFTYIQYLFFQQWNKLRAYAKEKGVGIIGDMPIYVALDSADVWAEPKCFQLDEKNVPKEVSGVPPDYFSADGQLWGNPLYDWDAMKRDGYGWWIRRIEGAAKLYDVLRIDHFRGFDEYYSIPYGAKDATNGHWEKGPGMDLFNTMKWRLGDRRVIAEDLGFMTDTVRQLVKDSGFPGMKVLEFAFDSRDTGAASDYLPHNYIENCVVYTGTHDNETLQGWFKSINKQEMQMVRDYLCDAKTPIKDLHKPMIAAAMRSNAATCIIPMQDYLGLDNSARTNQPSTVGQNWRWRVSGKALTSKLAQEIRHTAETFGRL